ncbi:hypothetical protein BM536_038935 [Streptomyces phaeoluteigriseus]|uniref:Uncharacterized protein n=1 Tax=Streptomyces phaeoluteigriseus TaxID=114686 RepID=A0A1V6MH05_9ACTN|nr:hypothetical protein [Streptomyces phaeoluteigriseus]OQD51648.1 hypothetical protein BM536_038935 [Streptomyces phaeoluteigriseus]
MVDQIPPYLSPEQLKHLQRLADASWLRVALYASLEPPPVRRRSQQYPGGRPSPWWSARLRRRRPR